MSRLSRMAVLAAALLLFLSACGPAAEETAGPSIPAQVSVSPMLEAASPVLEFADQFEWYDRSSDPHDFMISEGTLNGQLCYRLDNEEYGVTILVPENGYQVQAVLLYQERQLTFDIPVFVLGHGNVSGVASLQLEDLTGDGIPELVYIYGGGGTGTWEDQAKVIDLASMSEYPVIWDDALFENAVQLQFLELREDEQGEPQAVYQITGPDGETVRGGFYYGSDALPPEMPTPAFGYYESIFLADGQLILTSAFSSGLAADPSLSGLGSLSAPFVYDEDNHAFSLRPDFALTVWEPIPATAGTGT